MSATTLGILAGGAATRMGGRDKAWLERAGIPQVLRWQRRFAGHVDALLVSANRDEARYRGHGLVAVRDDVASATPWLLTLPVDLVDCSDCLLPTLRSAAGDAGAWAEDDEGRQPLVALWRVDLLRAAAPRALARGALSVRDLQAALGMTGVRLAGVRFGNLNTPADLALAGVA